MERDCHYQLSGLSLFLLTLAASQASACFNLCTEYATKRLGIPPLQCIFCAISGCLICLLFGALSIKALRQSVSESMRLLNPCYNKQWLVYVGSCWLCEVAYVSMCLAIEWTETGDTMALITTARLILTGAIAWFWFQEPVWLLTFAQWVSCLVGAVLITQPSYFFANNSSLIRLNPNGVIAALIAGTLFAVVNSCLRQMGGRIDTLTLVCGRVLCGFVVVSAAIWAGIFVLEDSTTVWKQPEMSRQFAIVCLAMAMLFPFVGFMFAYVFSHGEINQVTLVASTSMITAYVLQSVLFQETLNDVSYIGAVLVFFGGIAAALFALVFSDRQLYDQIPEPTKTYEDGQSNVFELKPIDS